METVTGFLFLGSKITVDNKWSHEIKRCLLLGRKVMTNLDNILKSRDITLPIKSTIVTLLTKVSLVKAIVFSVVMQGCESWTINKAKCWRTDAFELWCCRRLLRVPWTSRSSSQLILKGNQPWIFIGRTDAEALIVWLPDVKGQPTRKYPNASKDWRQEEKGVTEDEMVGWHHQLNGHES